VLRGDRDGQLALGVLRLKIRQGLAGLLKRIDAVDWHRQAIREQPGASRSRAPFSVDPPML
jgi:hypothetical protein